MWPNITLTWTLFILYFIFLFFFESSHSWRLKCFRIISSVFLLIFEHIMGQCVFLHPVTLLCWKWSAVEISSFLKFKHCQNEVFISSTTVCVVFDECVDLSVEGIVWHVGSVGHDLDERIDTTLMLQLLLSFAPILTCTDLLCKQVCCEL